ncbi:MAG: two-component system, OmpR family, response regulator MprA [Candidatus Eremiobacteraeota bacterium]|jgi:two-component system response regulator MprA|nr:two-component system, OmpR family, response regulator MprA [Candidatus Eremiobacteraeota bacterium]
MVIHRDEAGPPPRLLVVDDERPIREMLELGLKTRGFDVRSVADGPAAIPVIKDWKPELILLDVMMPKVDGFTMLPMLRRLTEAPIVMLSARGEVESRVTGLNRGADDYVAKPFEMPELVARLRSALRRPRLEHVEAISYADVEVELQTRTVRRAGRVLDLSPLEYHLFVTLLRQPRRVFTREQLLDLVWGDESEVGPGSVERYVSYLRAKVDEGAAARLIHTIRGVGYSLHDG